MFFVIYLGGSSCKGPPKLLFGREILNDMEYFSIGQGPSADAVTLIVIVGEHSIELFTRQHVQEHHG